MLNLSHNAISVIENLDRLHPSLTKLDLSHNTICELGGLGALVGLVHLNLSDNRIQSLVGLEHLAALETLHLANNRIGTFHTLRSLGYLTQLHTVMLLGNPIAEHNGYRKEVASHLPTLLTLDGERIEQGAPTLTNIGLRAPRTLVYADAGLPLAPQLNGQLPYNQPSDPQVAPGSAARLAAFPLATHAAGTSVARPATTLALEAPASTQLPACNTAISSLSMSDEYYTDSWHAHDIPDTNACQTPDWQRGATLVDSDRWQGVDWLVGSAEELTEARNLAPAVADKDTRRLAVRAADGGERKLGAATATAPARLSGCHDASCACHHSMPTTVHVPSHPPTATGAANDASTTPVETKGSGEVSDQVGSRAMLAVGSARAQGEASAQATIDSLRSEKELLQMRLDAMTALQAMQEDALCAGTNSSDAVCDDDGADGVRSGEVRDGHARDLVRGWRLKAFELLVALREEQAAHEQQVRSNLEALEAGATELMNEKRERKLLGAHLAVAQIELSAERRNCACALEDAKALRAALEASEGRAAAERTVTAGLVASARALQAAHEQAEVRLAAATSATKALEERLSFAADRMRCLTSVKKANLEGPRQRAVTSAIGVAADGGIVGPSAKCGPDETVDEQVSGPAHLVAEVRRLRRERNALLARVSENAHVAAVDEACSEQLHELRVESALRHSEVQELSAHVETLESRCAALEAERNELVEAAALAGEGHIALVTALQARAAESLRELEEQRVAERAAAEAAVKDALGRAEMDRHAAADVAANLSESLAASKQLAEEAKSKAVHEAERLAEARARAAKDEAAALLEAAEHRAEASEREALGLRRELTKAAVAQRSLEREVGRLRSQAEAAGESQCAGLEQKIATRDAQIAALRKERNALLSSLRSQQRDTIAATSCEADRPDEGDIFANHSHGVSHSTEGDACDSTHGRRESDADESPLSPHTPPINNLKNAAAAFQSPSCTVPNSKRRTLSLGLLDELQSLSHTLLNPSAHSCQLDEPLLPTTSSSL